MNISEKLSRFVQGLLVVILTSDASDVRRAPVRVWKLG